jgi:hypothetical protein
LLYFSIRFMKNDKLKQFVSLREQLLRDRAELEARLADINRALGAVSSAVASTPAPAPAPAAVVPVVPAKRGRKKKSAKVEAPVVARSPKPAKAGKVKNKLSLREAVLTVTKAKALTRQEILSGVQKLGYVFKAKDPLNSLSTLLYTDKGIKNVGGKFGPA